MLIEIPTDTGCDGAKIAGYMGRCINCTLGRCLEDTGNSFARNSTIRNRFNSGCNVSALAHEYKLTPRQVYRIVGR